jgi:hypothetical protein
VSKRSILPQEALDRCMARFERLPHHGKHTWKGPFDSTFDETNVERKCLREYRKVRSKSKRF